VIPMSVSYMPNLEAQGPRRSGGPKEPEQREDPAWPSPPDPGDLSKRLARRRAELHLTKAQVAARPRRRHRRIAFSTTSGPMVLPVNFAAVEGTIVIRTGRDHRPVGRD